MKKLVIFLSIFTLMLVAIPVQAQITNSKVGNPEAYMTPDQLAKYYSDIKTAELEKKLETYGNWVGVGGEVGIAIKEGLTAVVDVADKFSGTDVGKFTMILVAWKVMGEDLVRILLGFIFFALVTWLFIKVYNNTYQSKKVLTEKTPNGWFRRASKKYTIVKPDDNWDGYNFVRVAMLFMYAGAIGITYSIMFA